MRAIKVAFFSSKPYDIESFDRVLSAQQNEQIRPTYFEARLSSETADLVKDYDIVCPFVNDILDRDTLTALHSHGIRYICLRCAGFNNVDLDTARELGLVVTRVPAYSPESVAEHTIALIMGLNRKLHKAYNRVKDDNFSLAGLLGFDLHGKTVGVIGTGQIGLALVRILKGFGCRIICFDPNESDEVIALGASYVSLEVIFSQSDIISLHCPLMSQTHHLINEQSIAQMKDGVMIINTSRGGLVDTQSVINGLKNRKIGYLGLDVYEMEGDLFFEDKSLEIIQDDIFQRLLTFPNVIITGHQGFFTQEALQKIADTTIENILTSADGNPIAANRIT